MWYLIYLKIYLIYPRGLVQQLTELAHLPYEMLHWNLSFEFGVRDSRPSFGGPHLERSIAYPALAIHCEPYSFRCWSGGGRSGFGNVPGRGRTQKYCDRIPPIFSEHSIVYAVEGYLIMAVQ